MYILPVTMLFKPLIKKNKLDDIARKTLIDALITWAVKTKIKLTKKTVLKEFEKYFFDDKVT